MFNEPWFSFKANGTSPYFKLTKSIILLLPNAELIWKTSPKKHLDPFQIKSLNREELPCLQLVDISGALTFVKQF